MRALRGDGVSRDAWPRQVANHPGYNPPSSSPQVEVNLACGIVRPRRTTRAHDLFETKPTTSASKPLRVTRAVSQGAGRREVGDVGQRRRRGRQIRLWRSRRRMQAEGPIAGEAGWFSWQV